MSTQRLTMQNLWEYHYLILELYMLTWDSLLVYSTEVEVLRFRKESQDRKA